MFLRSTVMDADHKRIDEGIRWTRSTVLPFLQGLDGNRGLTMLVSRASGRVVISSAWGTREAMRASEPMVTGIRGEAGRMFGAQPTVEEWQMAELHRVRQPQLGFASRATRVDIDPGDVELLIDTYRTTTIPALDLLTGFCSAALLVDGDRGKAVSLVTWESREAMEQSRRRAAEIRQVSAEKAHARPTEVMELELAIAELQIPEEGPTNW
jgi:heme-degrading monooxygenase HmoA